MEIPKYVELYRKDLILKNYAETSIDNLEIHLSHNHISKIVSPLNSIQL